MAAGTNGRVHARSPQADRFYRHAMSALQNAEVPFLVGGTYSLSEYTGIARCPKDFDIFVQPADVDHALDVLADVGYRTELTFAHWLGKAYSGADFIDLIFSSGNGVAKVDDLWFAHATAARLLDHSVLLCPPEESIWSKAFVAERERYDGADINHLILCRGRSLDWNRLLGRFGPHWRVLLSHLVLFGFTFPSERDAVPAWVMSELIGRIAVESAGLPSPRRICQGTLLSRVQYAADLEQHGFQDARLEREAGMTAEEIRAWTAAASLPAVRRDAKSS